MSTILTDLQTCLSPEQIVSGDALLQRATSYWNSAPTRAIAMLHPRSTEEVSQILKLCQKHNQPLVTQGGLTGVTAGQEARENELILSLEKMHKIEAVDTLGATVTLQAGVVLQVAQEKLAQQGLLLPVDLGARGSCTVGGNVATNAGGINVLRYGMVRNQILGLEVVLADGMVVSSMNEMLKNNAGYDVKQLFIGSEGTLGIVTRVILRCQPLPKSTNAAFLAAKSFDSVVRLLKFVEARFAGTLSAFETMWNRYYADNTEAGSVHKAPLPRDYPFYVMLQAEGANPEHDKALFDAALEQALEDELIVDAVIPRNEQERLRLWDIRDNFDHLLRDKPVYLYDVSLPIRHMQAYVDEVEATVASQWPQSRCYSFGHIADGNVHFFIHTGLADNLHKAVDECVYQPLSRFNGSVSAEHGIGIEKKSWLPHSRNAEELALMQTLKRTLDPKNLLNPGRIIDI